MRLNAEYIIRGVKVALGAAVAIALANWLGLEYSATAGIITVLSIMGTKRETLRIAASRLLALGTALLIAFTCYSLLGYTLAGFAVYLFLFAVACYVFGWAHGLAMISVLMSHFYAAGKMDLPMLGNELLLFAIGTTCGIVVNLHLRADEKDMRAHLNNVDALMKDCLRALAARQDATALLDKLGQEIGSAGDAVLRSAGNRLIGQPVYEGRYVQMRSNQRKILRQMATAMAKIDLETPQHDEVCALLARVAEEYHMENDVAALLAALEDVLTSMRAQALPVSRDEFESRAVLYYVLLRLQDFLMLKRQFYQENPVHR